MSEVENKKELFEGKGFLMFVSVSEMFTDILRWNNDGLFPFVPKDSYFLICSRTICTSMVKTDSSYSMGVSNEYQSKYKNVEFLMSLLPTPQQMEYVTGVGIDSFSIDYIERLMGEVPMKDIISICDIVANKQKPVFVICSRIDFDYQYPYLLRDFILNEFGLQGYLMEEVDVDNVEQVLQIGEEEAIRKSIEEHVAKLLRQTDKDYFINELAEDMEKAYRDMLGHRTEEELKKIANEYNIFISRRYTKEQIIDRILAEIVR